MTVALSFVIPVYDEEGNVAPLHREITRVAATLGRPYEILFVDDGSRDETLPRLHALRADDAHVRVVELAANAGEAAALSAGFAHARGEIVVTLDGDGQNDPADVPRLLDALGPDVDVVSGRRRARQEDFWSRVLPSRVANGLIAVATGVPVHDCGCGLKAYRRHVVAGTQLARGTNRFLPAIVGVAPGRVREVEVNDRRRRSGRSHYGLARTAVVLRDLPALPFLTRWAAVAVRPGQVALVAILVAAVVGGLGWPEDGAVPGVVALAIAAALGGTIAADLGRVARARAHGVFRVRRVA